MIAGFACRLKPQLPQKMASDLTGAPQLGQVLVMGTANGVKQASQ
jgi:hypothetical protein